MAGTWLPSSLALLLLLLAAGARARISSTSYCELCPDHTMCKLAGPGPKCQPGAVLRGVSTADRKQILHVHNDLRNLVAQGRERRGKPGPQPPAGNMKTMVWDNELATIAQRWADQCNFEHDTCRITRTFKWVGQNLAQMSVSGSNVTKGWPEAIQLWYDEVELWNAGMVPAFKFNLATGHYTQLIWADTEFVGCGFTGLRQRDSASSFFVCNYGPSGNIRRKPLYKPGEPRSLCPNTPKNPAYPGLCGRQQ